MIVDGNSGLIKMRQRKHRFPMATTSLWIHSGSCSLSGWMSCLDQAVIVTIFTYRCWCPDRTLAQARNYISDSMGTIYAEGVILDLEKMWGESDFRTPLICFLSMGSDPTNSIEGLAKKLKLECRSISMGQGQEVHARRLIQQSMASVCGLCVLSYKQ